MDIKNLNRQQYDYLFEIDKIKRALFITILEHNKLAHNQYLSKSELRRIDMLLKDFRLVCFKVIRCQIESPDDYTRYIKTLLIIVSKIRTIIIPHKGIRDGFKKVYKLLPQSENKIQSFLNGYFTRITMFSIQIALIGSLIANVIALSTTPTFHQANITIVITGLLILYILLRLLLYRKIENSVALDNLRRTIDKNIFYDKKINPEYIVDLFSKMQKWFK